MVISSDYLSYQPQTHSAERISVYFIRQQPGYQSSKPTQVSSEYVKPKMQQQMPLLTNLLIFKNTK